jgi:hypothetical protein
MQSQIPRGMPDPMAVGQVGVPDLQGHPSSSLILHSILLPLFYSNLIQYSKENNNKVVHLSLLLEGKTSVVLLCAFNFL